MQREQSVRLDSESEKTTVHVYEVRPRKDKRGVDLISDVLPFGRLWYSGPDAVANAVGYAQHCSRSHHVVIRVLRFSWKCDREGYEVSFAKIAISHTEDYSTRLVDC